MPTDLLVKKNTVTKKKLINFIAKKNQIQFEDVQQIIQAFLGYVIECLAKKDRLELRDFGIFEVVKRKQKIGRNPKKAIVPIIIPARWAVKFTPGKRMDQLSKSSIKIE